MGPTAGVYLANLEMNLDQLQIWIGNHLLTLIESEFLGAFFNELSLLGIVIQRASLNFITVVVFWKI